MRAQWGGGGEQRTLYGNNKRCVRYVCSSIRGEEQRTLYGKNKRCVRYVCSSIGGEEQRTFVWKQEEMCDVCVKSRKI